MLVVVALGGNALQPPSRLGDEDEEQRQTDAAAAELAELAAAGAHLVVTHGNGPQVGNALLRSELAAAQVPPLPLPLCVAQTQGEIGTRIALALRRALDARRVPLPVVTILTHVVVRQDDPGFALPDKPVGRFYASMDDARRADPDPAAKWVEVAGHGYRRVVPSPHPQRIVELEAIATLVGHACVVAAGGGGIPVDGGYRRLSAVLDKDASSSLLATALGADTLLILTDVAGVALDFGRPSERYLRQVTAGELRTFLAQGQFGSGSMAPKVRAACDFVDATGRPCVIAELGSAHAALLGRVGTRIGGGAA